MQLFLLQTTLFILFKCVCVYPFFLHIYIYILIGAVMFIVKSNTCEIPIFTKIKKSTKSRKNNLLKKSFTP